MKSYKEWIFIAKFSGNLTTVVIVNFSLQEGTEEAEEHNTKMIDAIKETPKPDLLLVMGDFNAHIGKEDASLRTTKGLKNGQLLLDLAQECNMVIFNTKFQKKTGKLWSYLDRAEEPS